MTWEGVVEGFLSSAGSVWVTSSPSPELTLAPAHVCSSTTRGPAFLC